MGGHVDNEINKNKGPYVFRLNGQNHHLIGSLLPVEGKKPSFAQLYIYDTENELKNRIHAFSGKGCREVLDSNLMESLLELLDKHNVLAQTFRMARDRFKNDELHNVKLCLYSSRERNGAEYNLPTSNEVAGLIVGDLTPEKPYRDIVVQHQQNGLVRITELHPSFMALQYPLLFPYGEDGFRKNLLYSNVAGVKRFKRNSITMNEYYAFRLQQRALEAHTLLNGGRLFLQYCVDAYTSIEEQRLKFIRTHQDTLRSDLYSGLHDAISKGDVMAEDIGKRILLPSSHTGSPRYRVQNYQDAMAICRTSGCPDLFLTFTCNPKWEEIQHMLAIVGQTDASERPDIMTRVFKIKLDSLMHDIKKNQHFGRTIAILYTIEFQKRGLPHAYILIFLHPDDKYSTTTRIDDVISAEIPDNLSDPVGFAAVQNYMIHGPCGIPNPSSPCMQNKKCTNHFPKPYYNETTIDATGYPIYKRRKASQTVIKKGISLDNQFVVPYNRSLLVKYQAHMNVDVCNHTRSIKYLFKYINKQPDRATAVLQLNENTSDLPIEKEKGKHDEIKQYIDCRYVSSTEACWRIFQFDINYKEPGVERLSFHLANQQNVTFRDGSVLKNVLTSEKIRKTMLTEWMTCNRKNPEACNLSYLEFPTKWVWHNDERKWTRRKKGKCIGRIYYAHPTSGERYYLRMLLNVVKGCTSFEDIRTVNGVIYPTYKEACYALGLLGDDKEWNDCLHEASIWASGDQLRHLFAMLLLFCEVTKPCELWKSSSTILTEDIPYKLRKTLNFQELELTQIQLQDYALTEIDVILRENGKKLGDFCGMPIPKTHGLNYMKNRLIHEELNYDTEEMMEEFKRLYSCLNPDQSVAYHAIIESVEKKAGLFFFVSGYGGTSKTYLWRTILCHIRSGGNIVLAVASSGIASLLLPGGRTAHSRFHIPIDVSESSTCDIKQGTQLAELLKKTSLIIWDEAPMATKYCFESLDRTLRDIMRATDRQNTNKLFGGITTVLGGDFRQILPVIPKGRREDIVNMSIKRSYLWEHVNVLQLQINMRLQRPLCQIGNAAIKEFSDWIIKIGDGVHDDDTESEWIDIPSDMLLKTGTDEPLKIMVDSLYPDLESKYNDPSYLTERAILAPTNETVQSINDYMVQQINANEFCYRSSDSICNQSFGISDQDVLYPAEFLNSLQIPGLPIHELILKVGLPVMLLRNINQSKGLCNGTRLIITKLGKWFIQGEIITGTHIGDKVFIPRIVLSSSETKLPFTMKRRQFPISVSFAMTINKSQG